MKLKDFIERGAVYVGETGINKAMGLQVLGIGTLPGRDPGVVIAVTEPGVGSDVEVIGLAVTTPEQAVQFANNVLEAAGNAFDGSVDVSVKETIQ